MERINESQLRDLAIRLKAKMQEDPTNEGVLDAIKGFGKNVAAGFSNPKYAQVAGKATTGANKGQVVNKAASAGAKTGAALGSKPAMAAAGAAGAAGALALANKNKPADQASQSTKPPSAAPAAPAATPAPAAPTEPEELSVPPGAEPDGAPEQAATGLREPTEADVAAATPAPAANPTDNRLAAGTQTTPGAAPAAAEPAAAAPAAAAPAAWAPTPEQEKWLGGANRQDPFIMARMPGPKPPASYFKDPEDQAIVKQRFASVFKESAEQSTVGYDEVQRLVSLIQYR